MTFRLTGPIGADYNHDLDDVFRSKKALKDLGHFETPAYGVTEYPDQSLFDGVRSFQRANGLKQDGIMKPGGGTERAIGKVLGGADTRPRARGIAEAARDREPIRREPFDGKPPVHDRRPEAIFGTMGEVGWGRRNHPSDVLAARRALAWSGHLPAKQGVDSKDADNDLFRAIENFQGTAGVKRDGWMGPAGETARALDKAIAPKVRDHLKTESDSERVPLAENRAAGDGAPPAGAKPGAGDGAGNTAPPAAPIPKPDQAPPIPDDKKDWFKGREREWRDFYAATGKLPGGSETERHVYMRIFGREGGMAKDPNSSAASGLLAETAKRFIGTGDLSHVKPGTKPKDLPAVDRARLYRRYMDAEFPKIGGHKVFERIGDEKGAVALAEGVFRFGHEKGAKAVQKAMKNVDPRAPEIDEVFGSKSLAAYRRLLADPATRGQLLNAIANELTGKAKGETGRFDKLRP